MPRGVAHSEATKAAVLAALLSGQGIEEVAAKYELPKATVKTWKTRLDHADELVQPEKRDELGALVGNVLGAFLTTVQVQSELVRDADWLKKQSAADVAVLIGVLTDKAVRILSAIEPPGSPGGSTEPA